jgi:hypothetical protein
LSTTEEVNKKVHAGKRTENKNSKKHACLIITIQDKKFPKERLFHVSFSSSSTVRNNTARVFELGRESSHIE